MKRNTRAEKARETLSIIEAGHYYSGSNKVEIGADIHKSVTGSILYRTDAFTGSMQQADSLIATLNYHTEIKVINTTVLEAAEAIVREHDHVGCLNFASAKNPGGGFLGGAQAQEESLALSSALYPTLIEHFEMYEYNRGRSTYLYADYMIYSPDVVVFRDDDGELLSHPYKMTFITSPAVNIGAMKHNRPEELLLAKETMLRRMDKMLATFLAHGTKHLLLGAWGCGVFQNDPTEIASYFTHYLANDGKYSTCFKSVVFAVFDRSKEQHNISAFEEVFGAVKFTRL